MRKSTFLFIALSMVMLAVSATNLVIAKDKVPATAEINISNVSTDFGAGLLIIVGQNFPTNINLVVELGGSPMSLTSVTPDTIVAALPPNFPDGDYLLTVNDGKSYDEYDLTIKDTTTLQSQIDPCANGYAMREINPDGSVVCDSFLKATSPSTITIESTSGDVTIVAGATSVTVKPDGTVQIEGQTVNLKGTNIKMKASNQISMETGGNSINLDPASININSNSSLNIKSSGLIDIESGSILDIGASGILNLKGSLININ